MSRLIEAPTFQVKVVPTDLWWSLLSSQSSSLPWHETVLRPLLRHATEAWAYELAEGSEVLQCASTLVTRMRGKFSIDVRGEPILGRELFWNASGGKRGSIVIVAPLAEFPSHEVFPHCQRVSMIGNPSAAHTPSAVRFAKAKVAEGDKCVCIFPRNNGFEYFDLHAPQQAIVPLFSLASSLVPGGQGQNGW